MSDLEPSDSKTKASILRRLGEEFGLAVGLLTRLPVPRFDLVSGASLATGFWAFPLVGAIVGSLGAFALALATVIGLGTTLSALFAITTMVFVTGAFHEDGFADLCDGVGGGVTRDVKLEIMRDSRIGTYGALGLVFAVLFEMFLLIELIAAVGTYQMLSGVVAYVVVSRFMLAVPIMLLAPAREDGLGRGIANVPMKPILIAGLITILIVAVACGVAGLALAIGAGLGAAIVCYTAHKYLGGYTGDVLGATVVLSKLFGLLVLLSVVHAP